VSERPNPIPAEKSQQYRLLRGLLNGDRITPISSIVDYNCFAPMARCAELRKMGWPIRTLDVPHPNQDKFPGAMLPAYVLDEHFRQWVVDSPNGAHPMDYPGQEGRGKFTTNSK
jgi:hypothetical protein